MAVEQPSQSAYLDGLLETLQKYNHLFILIGIHAMRWHGTCPRPHNTFSILVRTSQHNHIISDDLLTQQWESSTLDRREDGLPTSPEPSPGDTVLRSLDPSAEITCLRLFTESLYCLPVDGPLIKIPAIHARIPVLYEESYHPDPQHHRYEIEQVKLPDPTSRLFVPTIGAHMNACWDQRRKYEHDFSKAEMVHDAHFNIRNYIRYLFLERPHQREKIVGQMCERNRKVMEERFEGDKRKICVGVDRETMTLVDVVPWEAHGPEAVVGGR